MKYAVSVGDGTNVTYTVTHNFGSRDVVVSVYDSATYDVIEVDVAHATDDTVTVTFAEAPSTDAYRVVVLHSNA